MKSTSFDRYLKKRVRSVESEVPGHLEFSLIKNKLNESPGAFENVLPLTRRPYRHFVYGAAAAAAAIAALLFLFSLFQPGIVEKPYTGDEVRFASVEGVPADTIRIQTNNPDMVIIWVEKNK